MTILLAALLLGAGAAGKPVTLDRMSPDVHVRIPAPHECKNYWPATALLNDVQGTDIVGFTIGADGTVSKPFIEHSSGDADLDDAALHCVTHWIYSPASVRGQAVAQPWQAKVVWVRSGSRAVLLPFPPCHVPKPMTPPPGDETVIDFIIGEDGTVHDVSTMTSSGDDALDQAALSCIATWRFQPIIENGAPVDVEFVQHVRWTFPR
jgi:TonB family protein